MHITAKYGQDRESTEGIYRLIELDLEPHDQGLHDSTWMIIPLHQITSSANR